ncbi:prepilin-type N-terminal cleavage/methylation domain-containing protein [Candidatus Gracilibacteria bacterium]|nr:prepilin-type N-terminal cleavage/methylation domain-containing protein [Candidatus Gracilibacteria bacterium]
MKKNGFTLVEILVVLIVIGILSVVLMKTYTFISQIAFRIQQEKYINKEILFISQNIQNFSDRNSIDYYRYGSSLDSSYGITDTLYLSGQDGELTIYSTGDCIDPGESIDILTGGYKCYLEIIKNGNTIQISNPNSIYLSKTIFKIIPYDSTENYLNTNSCSNYISCIYKPGFFMISRAYSPRYNNNRYNKIQIPIQQFFNSININE